MLDLTYEAFELHVRDCLTHLYDYAFLQNHPLPRLLAPDAKGDASRVQIFRQFITDAIESLKTHKDDLKTKQSRLYNILAVRYLQQTSLQHALNKLNLSERQFYRDQTQAVQVLCHLLWEQVKNTKTPQPADISIQTEITRLHYQQEIHQIEPQSFLQNTVEAIQKLCLKNGALISLNISGTADPIKADPTMLRQALILLMSQYIIHSPPCCCFTLSFDSFQNYYYFTLKRPRDEKDADYQHLFKHETLLTLIQTLNGEVNEVELPDDEIGAVLKIPRQEYSVLIIDDNPDVIALFRRYLMGHPYRLLTANQGDQAFHLAQTLRPNLIILDIMMPKQDGWEVLQLLKNLPETNDIPVFICSVLDTSEVAVSLGADGFLKKPPSEGEFFQLLAEFANTKASS